MLPFQRALRLLAPPLHQVCPPTATRNLSVLSKDPKGQPSEADIARDFRQGNFERGVLRFCRRPRSIRSNALHETVILACAQVPDAAAAEAVLHAMPHPTLSAVSNVVNALCREQNIPASIDILEKLSEWGIPLDRRMLTGVTRAAQKNSFGTEDEEMRRLDRLSVEMALKSRKHEAPLALSSAAEFFMEDGGDCEGWLKKIGRQQPERSELQSRRGFKRLMRAEASLRAARGDIRLIDEIWSKIQTDAKLGGEVGVMAAAVSSFVASGWHGGPNALSVLMSWVQQHLYNPATGCGYEKYTKSPSAMALLLTSASKAISAAARPSPELALSAFDALRKMGLPRFSSSLPLSGAYFKVLQHAALSLEETKGRIEKVREHHIQLDEQGFSMALGAILRCDARVVDKLVEGKQWVENMRSAGIPLTVQTYNLFAGQLRYCNDPELVTTLLRDMSTAGVTPTPVTYGLIFSACVIPGDYSSRARKNARPVAGWVRVLEAMEEHMVVSGVGHTANSRLSLSRAYAHLGCTKKALDEFDIYLGSWGHSNINSAISRRELQDAYNQMIYNLAHCREGSSDGPGAAVRLYEQMRKSGFGISGSLLDSLIVSCARMGDARAAVEYSWLLSTENEGLLLGSSGLRHLLIAQTDICEASSWEKSRKVILRSGSDLRSEELLPVLHKLVIAFARSKRRDICEDIMNLAGIEVADLDYIIEGREFLRFRSHRPLSMSQGIQEKAALKAMSEPDFRSQTEQGQKELDRNSRRAFTSSSVVPLL